MSLRGSGSGLDEGRIYRDPQGGIFFGVCAGLSAHFGVPREALRLALVLLQLVIPATIVLYLIAAMLLPKRPPKYPLRETMEELLGKEEEVSRLEQRLSQLEDYITSDEFEIQCRMRDS